MTVVDIVLLGLPAVCFVIAFVALLIVPLRDKREASARLRAQRDARERGLGHDHVAEVLYPGDRFRRGRRGQ